MRQNEREVLTKEELAAALSRVAGWTIVDDKLHREYEFADFTSAFGFMAASATVIEKMDHHPEWCNVYGKVRVDLWTHSSGGITSTDFTLAEKLEKIAQKLL